MARKPIVPIKTNTSVDVLNAIRNQASQNYQNHVPIATANADVIRSIGAVMLDLPELQNEFASALVNRIAAVYISTKSYTNPLSMFKKGQLEFGEVVENIYCGLAAAVQYDPMQAETDVFKRSIPDIRSAFHIMNFQKFYKSSIQRDDIKKAFTTIEGVNDLISAIVNAMVTSAEYDEFLVMKYMIAQHLYNGLFSVVEIPAVSTANDKAIVTKIKGISNRLTFMSGKYNLAGVKTHTPKDSQYLIVNSLFDSEISVNVLAEAFNMDKASFMGHTVLVDSFADLDVARLDELFYGDPNYHSFTTAELAALDSIPAILVDGEFWQIWDNMFDTDSIWNPEGKYTNYWLHVWRTFGISPFANAIAFVPATPSVVLNGVEYNNVDLSETGGSATIIATRMEDAAFTGTFYLNADLTRNNFASGGVIWKLESNPYAEVDGATVKLDSNGVLSVSLPATATFGQAISLSCTSAYDSTQTATVYVQIAEAAEA